MKELLNKFEQVLASFEAPVLRYFNPPMDSSSHLVTFIEENYGVGTNVPEDLLYVYEWHNGTNYEDAESGIIKLGYFGFELCLEPLPNIKETIEADESVYNFKETKLFPFCTSFNGEELAVLLEAGTGLIYCSTSDYEIPSKIKMYDDLRTFFKTMIEFYEHRCFQLNQQGFITLDFEKYDLYMEIGERMNPESDYWRVKREFREAE